MKLAHTLTSRLRDSNIIYHKRVVKSVIYLWFAALFLLFSACSNNKRQELAVEVQLDGKPLSCDSFEYEQQSWLVRQLAFFVSDIRLHVGTEELKPELVQSDWQTSGLTLVQPQLDNCKVDIKENEQAVAEPLAANHRIRFTTVVNLDEVEELSFSVAVPFALNHQNPLLQPSPLNLPSMFWAWRSGHKFFRIDLQAPDKSWVFHLGSVGCESASVMRSPQKPCIQPNNVDFRLQKQQSGHKLILHLDRLLKDVSIRHDESCLFHRDQKSCTTLMDNFKHQQVFEWQ